MVKLSRIGQGLGNGGYADNQVDLLRLGIELGMNYVDTSELYGDGESERLIGKAIAGFDRSKVIIGTKFGPENSQYADVIKAAERSLKRLGTDYIDLYQIHWPNPSVGIEETLEAMGCLVDRGLVKYIGAGNMTFYNLERAYGLTNNHQLSSLQVEYNLFDSSIEARILGYTKYNKMKIIAYSPLDKGRLLDSISGRSVLRSLADKYNKTMSQIVLAWITRHDNVTAIPKSKNKKHVIENAEAIDIHLEEDDIKRIHRSCVNVIHNIIPSRIQIPAQGENGKKIYQTEEEAKRNELNFVPSPFYLSQYLYDDDDIKPVRLSSSYELLEGSLRYWAWVIAFGDDRPIPSYIRTGM
tara:strand:+ start:1494 stop:2555 length:1062 start_codon:yes stop_codon:yes gene_type:complete